MSGKSKFTKIQIKSMSADQCSEELRALNLDADGGLGVKRDRLTLFLTGSGITLPDGVGHFVPTILKRVLITRKLSKLAFKSILSSLAFHRHPKQPSM